MEGRNHVTRFFLAAFVALSACVCNAQVGVWGGRTYTPQSFPRASYCSCSMCQSLRAQWAAYSARTQPAVSAVVQPIRTQQTKPQATTAYRTETRVEYVTQRVMVGKRCIGGVCYPIYENRVVPIARTVRVPVPQLPDPAAPNPPEQAKSSIGSERQAVRPQNQPPAPDPLATSELVATPAAAVRAMLRLLDPPAGSKLFDLGSGDGRVLIEATKRYDRYGVIAVGIELDADRAAESRRAAEIAGVGGQVLVFAGDIRDYDLSEATHVTMYLYPELMETIIPRLQDGTVVASYQHDIPGVESQRHDTPDGPIFIGTVGGSKPQSRDLVFGL